MSRRTAPKPVRRPLSPADVLAEVTGRASSPPICPCKTDVEDPGPHLSICPLSDPEYSEGEAF